jgi:hypothetical protein
MPDDITTKEKFNRFMNPKTVQDYGLSLSFDELISFDEGVEFVKEWFPWLIQTEEEKKREEEMLSVAQELGRNTSEAIDNLTMGVLNNAR